MRDEGEVRERLNKYEHNRMGVSFYDGRFKERNGTGVGHQGVDTQTLKFLSHSPQKLHNTPCGGSSFAKPDYTRERERRMSERSSSSRQDNRRAVWWCAGRNISRVRLVASSRSVMQSTWPRLDPRY